MLSISEKVIAVWHAMKKLPPKKSGKTKELDSTSDVADAAVGQASHVDQDPSPSRNLASPVAFLAEAPEADYSELLVVHHDRGSSITEEYRALRTSLLAHCPEKKICAMITSAEAGEGKSITCANLSLVLTERSDQRTILIDSDLRKSKLHKLLKMEVSPGLADVLRGQATLDEAIQQTVYPNLFFISAGQAKRINVSKLIGRLEMGEIVDRLRTGYDHVIFDTPPINVVSDAAMTGHVVGNSLLVVRMNKTRKESVDKAIRQLNAANINLIGIILTHQKYYIPKYLYRYS